MARATDERRMSQDSPRRQRVAIAYHFFAHYRQGVLRELLSWGRHEYVLVGDRQREQFDGIKAWQPDDVHIVHAPFRTLRGPVLYQSGLVRLALRRDLDCLILLGTMYWPMTWLCAILGRCTGKRVLFWTHGWTRPEPGLKGSLRRCFYRLAHGLLLYGHTAKTLGIGYGFDARRLHVLYNSLDYRQQSALRRQLTDERVAALRQQLFGHSDRPVAICTTRLTAQRRLDQLLDALDRLRQRGHEVDLLLVGDGPEKPALQAQARKLGLNVCFYGACYDEAVLGELIGASNVTVAPGKVGLTAMHSLVFGTPVITHDDAFDQMPEWEAIIPGKTGDLFRRGDLADLADKIQRWTRTALPAPAQRQACLDIIDRFWNPMMQRRVIERAVDGRPADDLFWLREPQ